MKFMSVFVQKKYIVILRANHAVSVNMKTTNNNHLFNAW